MQDMAGLWGDGGGKGGMQVPGGHMGPGSQGHQQRWPTPIRPMYNNMQYGQASQMPQKGGGKGYPGNYMPGQHGAPQRSSGGLLGPEHFQQLAEARAQGQGNDLQYMAFSL
mmetsp:Transcript_24229/g.39671  ORF Transcript_24229/g.39671 Transcript_24229/m.39671 type:complete len:111 (-) Transcript_24229:73-405(-)